jgi:hypothetical protein
MERPSVNRTRAVHVFLALLVSCERVETTDTAGRFDDESL